MDVDEILIKHLEVRSSTEEQKTSLGLNKNYWQDIGGVWILAPRCSGKTTALLGFCEILRDLYPNDRIMGITPYPNVSLIQDHVDFPYTSYSFLTTIENDLPNPSRTHLVIDEFMYMSLHTMNMLLKYNWRSVTGVSSVKF